jgi:hypothetical protein
VGVAWAKNNQNKAGSLSQDREIECSLSKKIIEDTDTTPDNRAYISNHESDGTVLDGYSVDPFYYSDLCVIDSVRMHLRDWWCDYSSRYLLLGHARLSSLSKFESSCEVTSPQINIVGSLFSLSKSLNDSS